MQDLKQKFEQRLVRAFIDCGADPSLATSYATVVRNENNDIAYKADFQCNGAMAVAKKTGLDPKDFANNVTRYLNEPSGDLDSDFWNVINVNVTGPGFINFEFDATNFALAKHSQELLDHAQAGLIPAAEPLSVFIDFAGPNVAKPMHVGHLRSTIIGDSLQRITEALGHNKISDAHFGDWGLQIGLLIIALEAEQPNLPYFNPGYNGSVMPDDEPPVTLEDLERMYPLASARMKEDEAWRDRARRATADMQAGRAGYRALHHLFWKASKPALEREFNALGIHFDLWMGESDVDPLIAPMVKDLKARDIAVPDDGAIAIHIKRDSDKSPMPPFLLVSSAGSAMYGTTDLATVLDRQEKFNPDLYLYVVDQRQALHFQQVFRAAEIANYVEPGQFEHIGFGTMNGADGKPFKTREGGIVKLHDLITTAQEKALARLKEAGLGTDLTEGELNMTARQIGTAALKFADLSNHRVTNYIFDFDRFVTFEGKTGPYLQYQGVRIKSLLRKAAEAGVMTDTIQIAASEERALALTLDAFNGAVHAAFDRRAPNHVAEHCHNLAQAFSSFYAACPILSEKNGSRLALAQLTLRQLELGLSLLGIEIPEKM